MFTRLVCLILLSSSIISYAQIQEIEWCNVLVGPFTWGEYGEQRSLDYDYMIMKYEVTNAQYIEFLEEAHARGDLVQVNSNTVIGYYDGDSIWSAGEYEFYNLDGWIGDFNIKKIGWDETSFSIESGYKNHPVIMVTWFGAWAFANHYGLRLPSEEEWEKVARGNTGWDYPWGDESPVCEYSAVNGAKFADQANCNDVGTEEVGSYYNSTSPYGAYDMAGNVWEWTDSFYGGICPSERVFRGGSWYSDKYSLLGWNRSCVPPSGSDGSLGFRCIRDSITVRIEDKLNSPNRYELYQNHPNPFNPTTNISYSIPQKSNVKLKVFNSLGQAIEILVNGIQGEGYYTIPFDASNLPSGIYFYQLITDQFTDVKKMVVAK
ncbi:SUMF1/EgtB/PvdO family nonheme iron enzyme [Bacteroidota bacterium]